MTVTPKHSLDDTRMWRLIIARLHPDAGGSDELCVFAQAARDAICSGIVRSATEESVTRRHRTAEEPARVPFDPGCDFAALTGRALQFDAGDYGRILALLKDCWPTEHLAHEQQRGASYKRLAAIAHLWGMAKKERIGWYRVAESIPLSDRHAGHILGRLKRRVA
jgi:hypothetical protein